MRKSHFTSQANISTDDDFVQIEQFIESIYPTQDPRAIARRFNGEKSEEPGTNNKALWDVLYLFGAVGVVLFFVLFILVRPTPAIPAPLELH